MLPFFNTKVLYPEFKLAVTLIVEPLSTYTVAVVNAVPLALSYLVDKVVPAP